MLTYNVYVLEDDVVFEDGVNLLDELAAGVVALKDNATDIVALGAVPIRPMRLLKDHDRVYETKWHMTHAYIVSKEGAKKIIEWPFVYHNRLLRFRDHYDHQLSERLRQAILFPTVAFQHDEYGGTSTNDQWVYVALTTLRDLLKQRNLQRVAEFLFMVMGGYNNILILLHIVQLRMKKHLRHLWKAFC